jgi:membrane protease subunit (stomatin/prohibitin family)
MGVFDFVKREVRQMAIARPDNMKHLIVYKHPDETVPKWAQLTVDSDEGAVFFKNGTFVQGGILGSGRHTLDGAMYPFLTGLVDKFAGGDVFKSEIFFVRTQPLRNDPVKFGGKIAMTDPTTKMPCQPMVHGEIVVRVMDPVKFIVGLTGQSIQPSDNQQILAYVSKKFVSGVRQALARILHEKQTSILEYDMIRDDIAMGFGKSVPDLDEIGLQVTELVDFVVKLADSDRDKIEKIWTKIKVAIIEKQAEIELKRADLEMRKMEIGVDVAERQAYVNMAQQPGYMGYAQSEAVLGAGQGLAKGGGGGIAGLGAQMAIGVGMAGMMQPAMQYQRVQAPPGGAVTCSACNASNPGGKFCANCGQPLAPPQPQVAFCPNCGQPAQGKFCQGCGAPLGGIPSGGLGPGGGGPAGGAPPAGPQGGPGAPGAPPGYPQGQQAAPAGYPPAPQGYPPAPQGYPPAPQGYPQAPQGQQQGYPPAPQGYPQAPQGGQYGGGYPPQGGQGQGGQS